MKQKILITAALPYANGMLHFGHIAGAYLPADCYARFERLHQNEVLAISGSDEYGVAIILSAQLENTSPKEHANYYHAINETLLNQLDICFDCFSRTTNAFHEPLVQKFFLDLYHKGYIEKKKTQQLFCEKTNQFLADRYVTGICPKCQFEKARGDECPSCSAHFDATELKSPKAKLSGDALVLKETTHFFMQFDQFKEQLIDFIQARNWKSHVTHFANNYIEDLRARSITRDLTWGVKLPLKEEKGKVFYVWFDAPIGYLSATQEWAHLQKKPDLWKKFWCDPKTKYVQFLGKDNIPFHAIFFPAMIMGQSQDYKLVDDLVASEFLHLEGKQFSKSEGWTIDLQAFLKRYSVDQTRYALAANAPENADSEFTFKDFQFRCNTQLVGKFGNFINRVLAFIHTKVDQKIPNPSTYGEYDLKFDDKINALFDDIESMYRKYSLRKVCILLMEMADGANVYFDLKTPWKEIKNPASHDSMHNTLYLCLQCMALLAVASAPLMPSTSKKIWELLGQQTPFKWLDAKRPLEPGVVLPKPYPLFTKIEDDMIEEEIKKIQTLEKKSPYKDQIIFEDFSKVDLRVGEIIEAEKIEKSKKLLKLTVDLGFEKRTILSGISQHYTPEELLGKKVVVVANLKPVKMMGIESQGMLLAGGDEKLEVLMLQDLKPGDVIS